MSFGVWNFFCYGSKESDLSIKCINNPYAIAPWGHTLDQHHHTGLTKQVEVGKQ